MLNKLWKYLFKEKSKDILGDYLEKVLKLGWKHGKKIFVILLLVLILILIGLLAVVILLFYVVIKLVDWLWGLLTSVVSL